MDLYLVEPMNGGVAEEYAFIDTFIGNMLSIEFKGKEYITNGLYYMLEKGKTVKIKVKENVKCCPLILKEQEKSGYVLLKKWCGSYLIVSKDNDNIMMVDTRSYIDGILESWKCV